MYSIVAMAQKNFDEFIDSAIKRSHFSDSDWAIGLETSPPYLPILDSLGNQLAEPEKGYLVIISSISGVIYIQRFKQNCYSFNECSHYASQRKILPRKIAMDYTVDSIHLVKNEWIYPYIYKNDSLGIYYQQEAGSHTPEYRLFVFSKSIREARRFDNISCVEKFELFDMPVNLNFRYNSSTFIYRSFMKFQNLFSEQKEVLLRL